MHIQSKPMLIFIFIALSVLFNAGCSDDTSSTVVTTVSDENQVAIEELWPVTVEPVLKQELWVDRDKYDAANLLLQPMQYAFLTGDTDKISQFESFFGQLNLFFDDAISSSRISTSQFLFFVSEYLVYKNNAGIMSEDDHSLQLKLQNWTIEFVNSPAWMWDRDHFENLFSRLKWKLNTQEVDRSYYRAMFDEDLFALAIISNLSSLPNLESTPKFTLIIEETKTLLKQMLENELIPTANNDGSASFQWLIQPGVWDEHPDYRYVGHNEVNDELEPAYLDGTATDSSHMHRWPVWLKAYKRLYLNDLTMIKHIDNLELGLAQQFEQVVYQKSTDDFQGPRLFNFFDGHNGVYRYRYATLGGSGYGPYELSSILFYGWYGNLKSAPSLKSDIELLLDNGFTLGEDELALYLGPNTSRDRNPMFVKPELFHNGMGELSFRVTLELIGN